MHDIVIFSRQTELTRSIRPAVVLSSAIYHGICKSDVRSFHASPPGVLSDAGLV